MIPIKTFVSWCKNVMAKMKRSQNQIRQPRPNAVDEIKTFDNDDKAA